MKTILWVGGDISQTAGNITSSKFTLLTPCGSTEMGMWPTLSLAGKWTREHWKCIRFHPAANIQFHFHSHDFYEAYVIRNPGLEDEQPSFKVFPNIQEVTSGDLFSKHPSDSQLWRFHSRVDDLQTFRSGEKYHPVGVEQQIANHPDIHEALLTGTGLWHSVLLVELSPDIAHGMPNHSNEVIGRIWPVIEAANEYCPIYAKITKSRILFVDPQRPMARTAKAHCVVLADAPFIPERAPRSSTLMYRAVIDNTTVTGYSIGKG